MFNKTIRYPVGVEIIATVTILYPEVDFALSTC